MKEEREARAHGLEIGAVSIKWVRRDADGNCHPRVERHGGDPAGRILAWFGGRSAVGEEDRIVVTGQGARLLLELPYRPETECLERALAFKGLRPDILLSLGGETFSVYPMKGGRIRHVISTSKCAAGTGEFIVQQFQRMGLTQASGLEAARSGRIVPLATRCSVHCKSDATHKLNKGECTPGDIARSLVHDLAKKVSELVERAQWASEFIVLCGGVSLNPLFVESLRGFLGASEILVLPESSCLEAYGAALIASESPSAGIRTRPNAWFRPAGPAFPTLPPLKEAEPLLDYRARGEGKTGIRAGADYLLGIDAGSTTTKAVLFDVETSSVGASCYLRTLGNPVRATRDCLRRLIEEIGGRRIRVIQAGVTGSGRELVSVFLGNRPSFNEILAHGRAAAHELPEVDTVFEIGGQDSKYISFLEGIPVDYAMNEGCSAGTGSFIEESASVDMGVRMEEISPLAEQSRRPISFGERCAAFINTDLRNALQQGADRRDVIAGLVYSIAENYTSRIVGGRQVGRNILFLGGVALNRAVALALAARTGRKIVVPSHPELMGAVGVAHMLLDRLRRGELQEEEIDLRELCRGGMEVNGSFRCRACGNHCEIQRIEVRGEVHPFGGLCSRYEMLRRRGGKVWEVGRDLVALRNRIVFEAYGPGTVEDPRGTIGLPMALSTFSLFPFYAKLIERLGYRMVLSRPSKIGNTKTVAPICYPCEMMHGAVFDLLFEQGTDFVFLPRVIELEASPRARHGYTCPSTTQIPDIIRAAFDCPEGRLLAPHVGLSEGLWETTLREISRMGERLGLGPAEARAAGEEALDHYRRFREGFRQRAIQAFEDLRGEPTVVLAGRPYVICSEAANLSLPRKITSRGYHVIPSDMLPPREDGIPSRDVWFFTQQISNAITHVRENPDLYLCLVSCFSCGPDGSMVHSFRSRLAGRIFCYLEIDSHTAHAGFETRLGAFLDIIEEGRRRSRVNPSTREEGEVPVVSATTFRPARLSDGLDHIVDSGGREVAFDDPRVVHVWTTPHSCYALRLIEEVYRRRGRPFRATGRPGPETMRAARRVCSGRECVPMTATVGAVLEDIERRRARDEITIYFGLDQEGPCQNGAWPMIWEVFLERLRVPDVISGVWPLNENGYLGMGNEYSLLINGAIFLGDLFDEAAHTVACLALRREEAMAEFEAAFEGFAARFGEGGGEAVEEALAAWAEQVRGIPLAGEVSSSPKVLIIGGLNLLFVHDPVVAYLIRRGILPKLVPYSESLSWLAAETLIRYGFRKGAIRPAEQFALRPSSEDRQEALRVRQSRFSVTLIESVEKRFREIMGRSGLLFDDPVPFLEIAEAGHDIASHVGFTETTLTAGRFVCTLRRGLYDGVVNLGSFNCQPAMNSQAVIRPLANRAELPYVSIDCEGPWLSAGQLKLLETLAVQAVRVRGEKNRSAAGMVP